MGIKKLKIIGIILLFTQIANANQKDEVLIAIKNNDFEKVQAIIKNKNQANWEINKLSVLYYAAYDGHDVIAGYLVEKGANILWDNGSDNSVLHAACHGCLGWLVEEILAKSPKQVNMPLNMHFPGPIEIASSVGCKISVMLLLQTGKIINKEGALKSALINENYDIAQIIIDAIDLDKLQIDGQNPFYFAYKRTKPEAVELLIKNGLDVNTVLEPNDPDGETLFCKCLDERKPDIVKLCLRNGASFKRKVKFKNYGEPVQELPVLDLLFKGRYLGDYNSEKWTDVANLLIDKASEDNDLLSITSDYKTVLELSISREYTPIVLNLVYQGEKCGIKIKQTDGTEISPEEYLAASSMNKVMPDSLQVETEGQEVFNAIDANNEKKLRRLINADNYYSFNQYNRTIKNGTKEQKAYILDYAVNSGHINIVKYLLSDDFSYSINNQHYYIAANNNDTEMFNFLIKADDNFDREGKWILYHIHEPVFVDILLKNGVNADEYIFNGQSFLFYEFRRGDLETINLFLKYSKELSKDYKQLFFAIEQNDIISVRNIINKGTDINRPISGGLTPLCWAAFLGQYDVAKLLIENNADISISWKQREGYDPYPVYGSAPLRWAIEKGHNNIVKLLIEHKASPIISIFLREGLNAFHLAAIRGNVEIMKMLINAYGSGNIGYEENSSTLSGIYNVFYDLNDVSIFNNRVATPFDIAAYYGNIDLCQLFLNNGLGIDNPDKQERNYYTPLYFAVAGRQLETAGFLIEKGAKINTDNTIVKECTWNGTGDLLKLLIENGAHVDTKVLLDATRYLDIDAVKAIVKAGGDTLKLNENSFSLLYNTIKNEHLTNKTGLINFLIDKGININDRDGDGTTVLHLAVESNDEELVTFLVDRGAEINFVTNKKEGYSKRIPKSTLDLVEYYPIYKRLKERGAKTSGEIL